MATKITLKTEETGLKILESPWLCFAKKDSTVRLCETSQKRRESQRERLYYYHPSKDAIVMDFYQRSSEEMQPKIETALEHARGLEA